MNSLYPRCDPAIKITLNASLQTSCSGDSNNFMVFETVLYFYNARCGASMGDIDESGPPNSALDTLDVLFLDGLFYIGIISGWTILYCEHINRLYCREYILEILC